MDENVEVAEARGTVSLLGYGELQSIVGYAPTSSLRSSELSSSSITGAAGFWEVLSPDLEDSDLPFVKDMPGLMRQLSPKRHTESGMLWPC